MDAPAELRKLTRPTSTDDLEDARRSLEAHLDLIDARSFDNEFLEVDLARRVAKVLVELLDDADAFAAAQRSILRAAIDYFLLTDDHAHDLMSPVGMEDDAEVLNVACELLGRSELCIDPS